MSPTWNAGSYENTLVKEFIHELKQLVSSYSHIVGRDEGKTSLMIKDRRSGKTLLEYWPKDNRLYKRTDHHKKAGVPDELSKKFDTAITLQGNPVKDPKFFIELLRKILEALDNK